jgi:hypothetical protein
VLANNDTLRRHDASLSHRDVITESRIHADANDDEAALHFRSLARMVIGSIQT